MQTLFVISMWVINGLMGLILVMNSQVVLGSKDIDEDAKKTLAKHGTTGTTVCVVAVIIFSPLMMIITIPYVVRQIGKMYGK